MDTLGKRSPPNWRAVERKGTLSSVRDVIIVQCDAKLGDAVYLTQLATELISERGLTVRALVSEELADFWGLTVGKSNVIGLPSRTTKPTLLRYFQLIKRTRATRSTDCLIYLDSGEYIDGFLLMRVIRATNIIGCGKAHFRAFNYSVDDPLFRWDTRHFSRKVHDVLKIFGIPYHSSTNLDAAARAIGNANVLFFNTYGAIPAKCFSLGQILCVIRRVLAMHGNAISEFIVSVPSESVRSALMSHLGTGTAVTIVLPLSVNDLVATVRRSSLIITPDTAIAHLNGAWNCKRVVFFEGQGNPAAWHAPGLAYSVHPTGVACVLQDISDHDLETHVDRLFCESFWQEWSQG